jgi:hypothetical protein
MRGWESPHTTPPRRLALWRAALLVPRLFPGRALHRAALCAAAAGAEELGERLFEAAARSYRRDLQIEPLARLRVHQLMFRTCSRGRGGEQDLHLEVERRLLTLREIECPRPPFGVVPARSLVGEWPLLLPGRPPSAWRETAGPEMRLHAA